MTPTHISDRPFAGFADLVVIAALAVVFGALVAIAPAGGTPVHLLFGLPLLVFAPGYAVVAALYPQASTTTDEGRPRGASVTESGRLAGALSPIGRFGASVPLSVAVVAAAGAVVNASPWLLRPLPLATAVVLATLAAVGAAAYRRHSLPEHLRYAPSVPWRRVAAAARPRPSVTFLLGVVLLASIAGAGAVAGGYAGPTDGDETQFTEFAVLTDDGSGGFVAGNYTETVAAGDPLSVYLANDEGEQTDYTVVLTRQTVGTDGSELAVVDATERDRRAVSLADGETAVLEYEPAPTDSDRPQRLRALLYRGDAPDSPTPESADRASHVWYDEDPEAALNGTVG